MRTILLANGTCFNTDRTGSGEWHVLLPPFSSFCSFDSSEDVLVPDGMRVRLFGRMWRNGGFVQVGQDVTFRVDYQ